METTWVNLCADYRISTIHWLAPECSDGLVTFPYMSGQDWRMRLLSCHLLWSTEIICVSSICDAIYSGHQISFVQNDSIISSLIYIKLAVNLQISNLPDIVWYTQSCHTNLTDIPVQTQPRPSKNPPITPRWRHDRYLSRVPPRGAEI